MKAKENMTDREMLNYLHTTLINVCVAGGLQVGKTGDWDYPSTELGRRVEKHLRQEDWAGGQGPTEHPPKQFTLPGLAADLRLNLRDGGGTCQQGRRYVKARHGEQWRTQYVPSLVLCSHSTCRRDLLWISPE